MRYLSTALLLLCLMSSRVQADPFVSGDVRDAAFYVLVTVEVQVTNGRRSEMLSTAFAGSSMCISPGGHVLTCKHVADPITVISQLIRESEGWWTAIDSAKICYTVSNPQGLVFYTDYVPDVIMSSSLELGEFELRVSRLETRENIDESKRNLHVFAHDSIADIMILKIEHSSPLPCINFATRDILPEDIVYAVAARKTSSGVIAAVLRLGRLHEDDPGPHTINSSESRLLLMTTIPGDSGAMVVIESEGVFGMMHANDPPEEADTAYMIITSLLQEFAIESGSIAPVVPELRAPAPPDETEESGSPFRGPGIFGN